MTSLKCVLDVQEFNFHHPVGTVVRYWRGAKEGEPSGQGPTRSRAYQTLHGDAAIFVEGCRGYVFLSRVEVVSPSENLPASPEAS